MQYSYDAANRLIGTQHPGGATAAFSYDTANRLTGYWTQAWRWRAPTRPG